MLILEKFYDEYKIRKDEKEILRALITSYYIFSKTIIYFENSQIVYYRFSFIFFYLYKIQKNNSNYKIEPVFNGFVINNIRLLKKWTNLNNYSVFLNDKKLAEVKLKNIFDTSIPCIYDIDQDDLFYNKEIIHLFIGLNENNLNIQ